MCLIPQQISVKSSELKCYRVSLYECSKVHYKFADSFGPEIEHRRFVRFQDRKSQLNIINSCLAFVGADGSNIKEVLSLLVLYFFLNSSKVPMAYLIFF